MRSCGTCLYCQPEKTLESSYSACWPSEVRWGGLSEKVLRRGSCFSIHGSPLCTALVWQQPPGAVSHHRFRNALALSFAILQRLPPTSRRSHGASACTQSSLHLSLYFGSPLALKCHIPVG